MCKNPLQHSAKASVLGDHGDHIYAGVKGNKVKEVDLCSAFIIVPHTQGAQVRIIQFYLEITLYMPLPRKRSPDGASPD